MDLWFCDAVVNNLLAISTTPDDQRRPLFWAVFLAFDEGEYYYDNNRSEDSEQVYTRPMIARSLKEHGLR